MPHMKWENSLPSSKPISSSDAACFWCSFVSVVNPTLVIKTPILSDRISQRFFLNDQKLWLASCHEILLSSLYKNSIFFSSITCFPWNFKNNVYVKQKIFWKFNLFMQIWYRHGLEVVGLKIYFLNWKLQFRSVIKKTGKLNY